MRRIEKRPLTQVGDAEGKSEKPLLQGNLSPESEKKEKTVREKGKGLLARWGEGESHSGSIRGGAGQRLLQLLEGWNCTRSSHRGGGEPNASLGDMGKLVTSIKRLPWKVTKKKTTFIVKVEN